MSSTRLLLIAHAPLASALRACALHVFPDCGPEVLALDVQAHVPAQESLAQARTLLAQAGDQPTLVLSDVFGATPCNVAQRLVEGAASGEQPLRLVAGVNVPMLLRAISYRAESLDAVVARALQGGTQGVMSVAVSPPQNQHRRLPPHDQDLHDHQQ